MSKFKKIPEKLPKKKEISDEQFAFKTVITSVILSGFFLLVSILFNGGIVSFNEIMGCATGAEELCIWDYLDTTIKVSVILLFYFFLMISIGNYRELVGKPIETGQIIYIFLLALLQSCLNLDVFIITLLGLVLLLAYFYLVQEQ